MSREVKKDLNFEITKSGNRLHRYSQYIKKCKKIEKRGKNK